MSQSPKNTRINALALLEVRKEIRQKKLDNSMTDFIVFESSFGDEQ